jgi:hypothetical protein
MKLDCELSKSYFVLINRSSILWKSYEIPYVVLSTIKVKYVVMYKRVKEILFIKNFLELSNMKV